MTISRSVLWAIFHLAILATETPDVLAGDAPPSLAAQAWPSATPEEVGIDSAALVDMFDFIREQQIPVHSIQLVRRGRLVLDAYVHPYDGRTRHDVASVTKSITSTLVGLAIKRGHIRGVQQAVLGFFPGRAVAGLDARKRRQTLEHLLTMQSGWDCGVPLGTPSVNADKQLAQMRRREDWAQFALDLPMSSEPGTRFLYCNANCHLLSALLTRVTGTNTLAFARRELFEPLGIRDTAWPADPQGNNHGWGDLQLHPRDMARIGQLFLQRGRWAGRQIIPEAWLRTATRAHVQRTGGKDHYGYYWWVSDQLPGLFEAVGRGGQRITVWPDKELVLVYTGGGFEPGDLAPFILKSLASVKSDKSDQPLPANPEANARLRDKLAAATRSPASQPVPELPAMAARISGKTYTLTANELDLATVALQFTTEVGGTGHRPVPPGDPPGGTTAAVRTNNDRLSASKPSSVPVGGSPTGAGGSPAPPSFQKGSEATVRFTRLGQELRCPVGLDGVERFSTDTLVELPFGCKGRWLTADTFLLELDRVAGISLYRFKLTFADEGKSVSIALSERTGLGAEEIRGSSVP